MWPSAKRCVWSFTWNALENSATVPLSRTVRSTGRAASTFKLKCRANASTFLMSAGVSPVIGGILGVGHVAVRPRRHGRQRIAPPKLHRDLEGLVFRRRSSDRGPSRWLSFTACKLDPSRKRRDIRHRFLPGKSLVMCLESRLAERGGAITLRFSSTSRICSLAPSVTYLSKKPVKRPKHIPRFFQREFRTPSPDQCPGVFNEWIIPRVVRPPGNGQALEARLARASDWAVNSRVIAAQFPLLSWS